MGTIHPFDRDSANPVGDEDFAQLISVANRLAHFQELHDRTAAILMRRIREAGVEPGIHTAKVVERLQDGVRYTTLVINGREHYREVSGPARRVNEQARSAHT